MTDKLDRMAAGGIIAIAGVSKSKRGFGWTLYRDMKTRGFPVVPLNPGADEIDGERCYAKVSSLPEVPALVITVTKPEASVEVIKDAVDFGARRFWMQPGSDSKVAVETAMAAGAEVVTGQCMFLHMEPVGGIHAVHRFIAGLFGAIDKG